MEAEMDIQAFVARLEDRFGKIPSEGRELIRVVRLKRMGKSLGMEKIILKNGRISIQLLSNTDSPYYQSQAFDKLLIFIQNNAKRCQLTEKNGKRTIQIKDVESVESACVVLEEILSIKL
jgi:transcription-repair coupling factor (superfamily II helicase)